MQTHKNIRIEWNNHNKTEEQLNLMKDYITDMFAEAIIEKLIDSGKKDVG